jgi:hypothetical protein
MPFDGDYIGVSRELAGEGAKCLSNGVPDTLIVRNSVVMGPWRGTVSTQGILAIHRGDIQVDGQINDQGIISGQSRGSSDCTYAYAWQKVPPPTMPFDGDYIGVSRELAGEGAKCLSNGVPDTLIVRNGVVMGPWRGTVSTQGVLAIHRGDIQVDGQINGQGIIRGQGRGSSGCTYAYAWQKQPG